MRFAERLGSPRADAPAWRSTYVLLPVFAATAIGVLLRLKQKRRERSIIEAEDRLAEIIRQAQPSLQRARTLALDY